MSDAAATVMSPTFFAAPAEFRAWLAAHHDTAQDFWVGLHKKGSGRPSITWPEAVDEALCVGWIDGLRKGVDAQSYFTTHAARMDYPAFVARHVPICAGRWSVSASAWSCPARRVAS